MQGMATSRIEDRWNCHQRSLVSRGPRAVLFKQEKQQQGLPPASLVCAKRQPYWSKLRSTQEGRRGSQVNASRCKSLQVEHDNWTNNWPGGKRRTKQIASNVELPLALPHATPRRSCQPKATKRNCRLMGRSRRGRRTRRCHKIKRFNVFFFADLTELTLN